MIEDPETADDPGLEMADAHAIVTGRHGDPFAVLGPHHMPDGRWTVRAFVPGAVRLWLIGPETVAMLPRHNDGLFSVTIDDAPGAYRLRADDGAGTIWELEDAYRFGPVIGAMDEHLFAEGTHRHLWTMLGAHAIEHEGTEGTHFAVWAPNAQRVSVIGDFCMWDGRRLPMRRRGSTGVWEIVVPGVGPDALYKYELVGADGTLLPAKADPVGGQAELRPGTGSVVPADLAPASPATIAHAVGDPISIYEVHLGSWQRSADGGFLSWDDLADRLIPYVADLGFTHIQTMPITEHPFDGSWGYQPVGLFAPTRRHGDRAGFRRFVDAVHAAGLGLIIDWVPAHFPTDAHGLARFDGTPLYEHADPREGYHPDWNTLIYNMGRTEVRNFLIANALFWIGEMGVDGLRVDAVASMLYRDYSREDGEWIPNADGGRENHESVAFLQRMNAEVYGAHPHALTIAEESTAWPGVSRPVDAGGLGFGYKWNMGWMHDTLEYMSEDPLWRSHHHDKMTFGLLYAFSENFVLPLSHDEVVHGKGSILDRMPGDRWTKFANLRAYYGFMWAHPGKKLLFMGQEFGQAGDWNHEVSLPWDALNDDLHAGVRRMVGDLNRVYRDRTALHARDCEGSGFEWLDGGAATASVYAWIRRGPEDAAPVICVVNFSGVEQPRWRVGVPGPGTWSELVNTDAADYGGAGRGNLGHVAATETPHNGQQWSIELVLPPLSTIILGQPEE